jgi:hypothetical protein
MLAPETLNEVEEDTVPYVVLTADKAPVVEIVGTGGAETCMVKVGVAGIAEPLAV